MIYVTFFNVVRSLPYFDCIFKVISRESMGCCEISNIWLWIWLSRNQFLNTECAAICQNFGRLDYSQNHRISIEWTYVCKETNPWKIFNHLLMPFLVVFVNMTQITLSLFCNVCFCSKCLMIFSSQVFHLDQNLYYLHVCDVINIA